MHEQNQKKHKNFEPTISDLEWVIQEFRKTHGEAELSVLLKELVGKKESTVATEGVETFDKTSKLPKTHIFKNKEAKFDKYIIPILQNIYFKRGIKIIGIYILIYFAISTPVYLERAKYIFNKTEKITVREQFVEKRDSDSANLELGEVIPPGSTLVIPRLNTKVPIVHSQAIDEKSIQEDLKKGVAKLRGTADPGEAGNTFLMGHSSGYFWDNSPYRFVFTLLDKVGEGDTVKIYHNNKKYVYQFEEKKIVESNDISVLNQGDKPKLTLMTCYPPGTINKRLVVTFKQVAPVYVKPKIITREKTIEVPKSLPSTDDRGFLDNLLFFWR